MAQPETTTKPTTPLLELNRVTKVYRTRRRSFGGETSHRSTYAQPRPSQRQFARLRVRKQAWL